MSSIYFSCVQGYSTKTAIPTHLANELIFHFGEEADCIMSICRYLNERRLNGDGQTQKRSATEAPLDGQPTSGKRPRGRPKGSKNRAKGAVNPSEGA
jgi:hypothetical protein